MPIQMALSPWLVIQLMARNIVPGGEIAKHQSHESRGAYYVDLASDEEDGVIVET